MTMEQTQRPRFYEGQYLGSKDLTDTLEYAKLQAARHALGAHTWGIAEGLRLREVPAIGDACKVSVVIDPGYAWDGFGRPIVVLEPYKIPEALFDSIKYDSAVDSDGKGRQTKIWLRYNEAGTKKPAAGFEVCDVANTYRRVQESFLVSIGNKSTHADEHDPIAVGGKSGDAQKALRLFDAKAPLIYDESIPQQTFPEEDGRAYWFVPIGYVRWLPADSGPGHFVAVSDDDKEASRRFRRYIGAVAENIEAADGAIRLRDRTRDPAKSKFKVTDAELVDVEGDARVEGDVNLAGGALNFRHADGTDKGTALRIQRTGDNKLTAGERNLEVGIGPSDQSDNRLEIGPLEIDTSKTPHTYTLDPKVTVVSDGKVGIGTTEPEQILHVVGDSALLESTDGKRRVDLRTDGSAVDVESGTSKLYLHSDGPAPDNQVIINPFPSEGGVGIGTENPEQKLHVVGDSVLLASGDGSRKIDLRTSGSAVDLESTTSKLYLHSYGAAPDNQVIINPFDDEGEVGIGTQNPEYKLHVVGDRIRLGNADDSKQLDLRVDGAAVDLSTGTSPLYIRSGTNQITMNPASSEGNIGVGTTVPKCKLHVANSLAGSADDIASHVAAIENTSGDLNADVLALKVGTINPGAANNFITFFDGNQSIGGIEGVAPIFPGDHSSIFYSTYGADYAESLPRLDEKERLEPGDVVGILDGKVTRRTAHAQHVGSVSDRPAVLANSPSPSDRRKHEKVAFVGQVRIRIRGSVRAGDCIVPSGADDGVGIAVPAAKLTPQQAGQIVGQAWESSSTEDVRRVLVAVGLPSSHSAPLAALVLNLGRQVDELKEEVKRLKKA